jgi:broad specificity phosphatase PhoE
MKTIDLMRHTANDGDVLTPEGVAAAIEIGRTLAGGYTVAASSGAQRATQTIGCLLAGRGEAVPDGVIVVDALRSSVEDRWRAAYAASGAGDLASLRQADAELVADDSAMLAEGLRTVFAMLPVGGRALAVGHSPTNEAAIFGLTGVVVPPMGKGDVISITEAGATFEVVGY